MDTIPYLKNIKLNQPPAVKVYPFTVPIFHENFNLDIHKNVMIIGGDNGTGKSTLLELIATSCGFNINGGNRNHYYNEEENEFSQAIYHFDFGWSKKQTKGFFMRAESFIHFSAFLDRQALEYNSADVYGGYGGKSLNQLSHGEAFLALFANKFNSQGIYILDEPEAALSPQKMLTFLSILYELSYLGNAQFIISTHSPVLMSYPYAQFMYIDETGLNETNYQRTEHYTLTKNFLNNPEFYFRHLFIE